jgi:hypothetical protein
VKAFGILALVVAGALATIAPVWALPPGGSAIIALIKSTPQLKIDPTVPSMGTLDTKTHPYVNVVGTNGVGGGYADIEEVVRGTLSDGAQVLVVPLISGGSGGVFTQIVFGQRGGAAARYGGYISSGGHLAVAIKNGRIVARLPLYRAGEANCCPSHMLVQTYRLGPDGKLNLSSEVTVKAPH